LPFLATLALTGGRPDEVLSLEVQDVDFTRELVHFRPNGWQRQGDRLKTAGSERTVRLWPQLAEILRDYLNARTAREVLEDGPRSPLLFPSPATGKKLRDARRLVDAVAKGAGWGAGSIRPRMFRHSYASARLQTLDRGEPVSLWTVAKELGHGSEEMLKKHYGRLGTVRHRAEVVEFRIEQHREARLKDGHTLSETIERLFGTTAGTTAGDVT
jgi:integrase